MALFFVTGASGFVGSRLVDELLRAGHRVCCLSRRPPVAETRAGVTWTRASLDEPDAYADGLSKAEYVVHLAGLLGARRAEEYRRANVEGTAQLLGACRKHARRLRRFVSVSSVAAMGPRREGGLLCEGDPCRPRSAYGASKLEAERVAQRGAGEIPLVILRPSFVYGPRDARSAAYLRAMLAPAGGAFRTAVAAVSFCHVADAARACLRAAEAELPSGEVFLIADPVVFTWNALGRLLTETLYRLIADGILPAGPLAQSLLSRARGLEGAADGVAQREYWGCDTRKAQAVLGFTCTRSVEEKAPDVIRSYVVDGLFAPAGGRLNAVV